MTSTPKLCPRRPLHGWRIGFLAIVLVAGSAAFATAAHAAGESALVNAGEVQAQVKLPVAHARAGQTLPVAIDFKIKPGWHIYGEPLPPSYIATKVKFQPPVEKQALKFPKPKPLMFMSLNAILPVYTGSFHVPGTLRLREGLAPGNYVLRGTMRFQECNDQICKLPRTEAFALPLTIDSGK